MIRDKERRVRRVVHVVQEEFIGFGVRRRFSRMLGVIGRLFRVGRQNSRFIPYTSHSRGGNWDGVTHITPCCLCRTRA